MPAAKSTFVEPTGIGEGNFPELMVSAICVVHGYVQAAVMAPYKSSVNTLNSRNCRARGVDAKQAIIRTFVHN